MSTTPLSEWLVVQELALPLGTDGRVPVVAVVRATAPTGGGPNPRGPEMFGLVGEVTSPSSRKTDLFAKPGEYAEAGIPLFWRLGLDPLPQLHAFALRGAAYEQVAVVDTGPGARAVGHAADRPRADPGPLSPAALATTRRHARPLAPGTPQRSGVGSSRSPRSRFALIPFGISGVGRRGRFLGE
jgi:hypothetical protein